MDRVYNRKKEAIVQEKLAKLARSGRQIRPGSCMVFCCFSGLELVWRGGISYCYNKVSNLIS